MTQTTLPRLLQDNGASAKARSVDCVIIGAGAAGLYAAQYAGGQGASVLVLDHRRKPAEKVRISGGGRCNFTNLHTHPKCFISDNPHFAKSALARHGPWDFIDYVTQAGISYHEKTLGQLFCDESSQQIIDMLLDLANRSGAQIALETQVKKVSHDGGRFQLELEHQGQAFALSCQSLVIASGGLSIPKIGATNFGYQLAQQFGHQVVPPRPGLVPSTFDDQLLTRCRPLAGTAVQAQIKAGNARFDEAALFTHRGLSGPAALQASSYWLPGDTIDVDLARGTNVGAQLLDDKQSRPKRLVRSSLEQLLPNRLAESLCEELGLNTRLADTGDKALRKLAARVNRWQLVPTGTEGYRTAEVTLGGVCTSQLSSKSMESQQVPGLYFIGEVVDVTGWLGGYNLQWAWSSAWAAGTAIAKRGANTA